MILDGEAQVIVDIIFFVFGPRNLVIFITNTKTMFITWYLTCISSLSRECNREII